MELIESMMSALPDGKVERICIGIHWTAVVVVTEGERRCGLATTLREHHNHGQPDVPMAGNLGSVSGVRLAALSQSHQPILRSVGIAALNALLPPLFGEWVDLNAEDALAILGAGKRVVLIGHFPFVPRLEKLVGELIVLEQRPQAGDLLENAAPDVVPQADVLAITSMTLMNQTFGDLMAFCSPSTFVVLLGPSTPMTPVLYDHGIDLLCGSVVTDIDPVLRVIAEGGNFRQIHRAGVRLVTMGHPRLKLPIKMHERPRQGEFSA